MLVAACAATSHAQFGPTRVRLAPVEVRRNVVGGHAFVGTVEPRRRSIVGSAVSGRVVELLVNAGDAVKKQQPLAKLLTKQLEIQIAAARAQRDLHAQELAELRNGALPEEKREAAAQMAAAKAAHDYAQQKLQRTRQLFERQVATEDQLQDDMKVALAAEHNLVAADARHKLVEQGPRAERVAQAAARLAVAEEEVNRLLDQLEKHTIYAPFDGYVVRELTEVGQWIMTGEHVVEVVQLDELEIDAQVLESFVPRVQIGSVARVELASLPQTLIEGRVIAVVPQADVRARSFPVKVLVTNAFTATGEPQIKAGMFARVLLPVEPQASMLVVPKDALVLGGVEPVVYAIMADPQDPSKRRVRQVPVKVGIADGSAIEVNGELQATDQVVVEGNERLFPGAEVIAGPVAAGAAPPGTK